MFFTKLHPVLNSLNLALDLKTVEEGRVKVIIKFKMNDENSEEINLSPIVLTGTPDELDNGLVDMLINALNQSAVGLSQQIDSLVFNLKKVLDSKTKAALGKKTTSKTVDKVKDKTTTEAPSLDFDKKEEKAAPVKRKRRSKEQIAFDKIAAETAKAQEVKKEEPVVVKEVDTIDDDEDLFDSNPVDKAELAKEDDFSDEEDDDLF